MNILRDIFYDGKYYGLFELRNVEGKFMWCPASANKYPKSYPYPKVLYKHHEDNPYNDYCHPYFMFEESDLDFSEEGSENNSKDNKS